MKLLSWNTSDLVQEIRIVFKIFNYQTCYLLHIFLLYILNILFIMIKLNFLFCLGCETKRWKWETMDQQWRIVFDGREVCHVKSKKNCIQFVVLAIVFVSLPILFLVLTLLFAPCFLLGKRGKISLFNKII